MATIRRSALLLALALAVLLGYATAASAATDVGYRDGSFNATSVDAPTGEKPQSKLWYNDGIWWASMFNTSTEEYHIYRLDRASQSWTDTGTLIDERNSSKADTLWDGSHLYVATAGPTSAASHGGRVLRYSYDAATKKYSLDLGFPVTVTDGGMEAIVLDRDTTGKLWVTYTQNNQVYVDHSLADDKSWATPSVLPVNGTNVGADDISGIAAFDTQTAAPQIGVMWSNQVDDAMYFATHKDGDPADVWQASRTAIQGPKTADDHISIRSVQADDVSGRVFVAVKTSLGDLQNPDTNAPLILLLVRDQAGNWTNYRFGRVIDHHTRPIVMIDQEHRNLYVFATHDENCGAIYYKKTPLSNISFSDGVGTPFIQSSTDTCVNNATSTKQNVNSATGLPVLASDNISKRYLHNFMDLSDADTVAPTVGSVAPADGATDVAAAANGEATFSEAMDPATLTSSTFTLTKQGSSQAVTAQVGYDAATKKATLDPQVNLDPSSNYIATLKSGVGGVKDLAGNPLAQDKTWSFTTAAATPPQDTTPPETTIDTGPSGTVSSSSASFAFSSNEAGSTFECALDAGAFGSCASPKSYAGLSDGSHTFSVRATDAAGNVDGTPATRTWTANTALVSRTENLSSVADAGLTELSPTANNGSATTLGVDGNDPDPSGGDLYAALRWDLSQIPAGATVSGATVTLNVTNSTVHTYAAYDLKRAWSEGQVNWSQAATGTPWATAGAKGPTDRGTKIADVAPTKKASYTFTIPASVVQGWLEAPSSSNGILLADPTAGTTNWDLFAFDTREGATPPKLSVTYTGGTDTSPPETAIDSGPSGTFTDPSASFTFSSNEAGSTFECALDAGVFGSCASPKSYAGLSDGSHTFSVRATDAAGNVDGTPATRTWTVDTSTQSDPVMVAAGDIASCQSSGDEATAALLDGISGTVVPLGDNVYEDGTAAEFKDCYDPSWGRHKARTKPTVGNHEYQTFGASGYYNYFGSAAGASNKGYYSYDLGGWHIISLNSMCENVGGCGATSPMVTWLKADLAANPKACTAAYFHHPLYSSGSEHGNDPKMGPSWDALYAAGAEVVLSGHDHDYERFAPQTPGGAADASQGLREFVVGSGGASHKPFGTIQPNSQVRNADTYGVLKMTLHPGSYDWQFVPEAGKTFTDSGTDQCHGAPGNADTTAPTVGTVAPADGATGVATTANAEATFSEAMAASTISDSTFVLTKQGSSQTVGAQVAYDQANKKATLNPTSDLDPGSTYTATVKGGSDGVKDLAGNPLAQDKAWSFTTAPLPQGSQTANLNPVADAGLTELSPTANNGSATTLGVDGNDPDPSGGDLYAALRWDLSQIPAGATVSGATVTLNVTNSTVHTYAAYDLKRAWSEGQVNWSQAATGTPWATAGAKGPTDRGTKIADVAPTKKASYTFTIPASVVQGWLEAPSSSNGILLADPTAGTTNWDLFAFDTREGATPPKLSVTYTGGTDTSPPETTIDTGPSGTVSSSSASFAFSSNEAGSTFECALDAGAFGSCASPKSYAGLSDGSHTFSVRATDAAGNVDGTPATRTWTANTAAPVVQSASLAPVADAGLTELTPTANNGSATSLKVDGNDPDPNGGDLYAALRWDLSQIPAGATIQDAKVTLKVTNPTTQAYGAYELKKAWSEGQVTWNQAVTGSPWQTIGAKGTTDRSTKIADVTPTAIAPYTFTIPASVVQGWLSAPSSNNGILISHTTNDDGFIFDTREGATPPKLTVNYSTP